MNLQQDNYHLNFTQGFQACNVDMKIIIDDYQTHDVCLCTV